MRSIGYRVPPLRWVLLVCSWGCFSLLGQLPQSNQAVPILGLTPTPIASSVRQEIDRLDPSVDGWTTEVIHEKTQECFKALAAAVQDGPEALEAFAQQYLDPSFRTSLWRPSDLTTVYDDRTLQVRESTGPASLLSPRGLTGLRQGLQSLQQAFSTSSSTFSTPLGFHFKTVGVDVQSPYAFTEVWVESHGHNHRMRCEQHGFWRCKWSPPSAENPKPVLLSIELIRYQESQAPQQEQTWFVDQTSSLMGWEAHSQDPLLKGIDHWRQSLDWRFTLDVTGPHGLAIGDVNGDGREDLYVCEPGGLPNRLLIQQADGSLRDESALSGIDYLEASASALWIDLDNDRDLDLVLASGRYILSAINDGQAHFKTLQIHESQSMFRSLSAIDVDQDGLLDLFACGYYARFGDRLGLGRPMPYHDANNGVRNVLLRNTGSGFKDITEEVGLNQNNQRFSYAAAWEDFDNDGDMDLYVANDFGRNNLYRNDGGRFVDIAASAGVEDISAGMSVSWADYNGDGWMDLYVGNMFSSAGNRIAFQRQYRDGDALGSFQRHARGNSLFLNQGDGTFLDTSLEAGVTRGRWSWSSPFVDWNNDGWEDILVANGMVTGTEDTGDL